MESFYHAYQAYEHQVELGAFDTRKPRVLRPGPYPIWAFLASVGDALVWLGARLKRPREAYRVLNGSPAVGKLDR